jgi:uncharacterized membrane protein
MNPSDIENRLASLETRLTKIEKALHIEPIALAEPPLTLPSQTPTVQQPPNSPGRWLAIVAVICFVLAAGFIIKLSIDSGWLTIERQIGLAALFGFVLIGTGFALLKKDREYASFLPGAGVIVLYITAFSAYSMYHLISFNVAMIFIGLISGICIWLYTEIRHDIYPIIASVGTYLAPLYLNTGWNTFSLYYLLICSIVFATLSVWLSSRLLTYLAAYLALIVTAIIGLGLNTNLLIVELLAIHFLIFAISTYLYSLEHAKALSIDESWAYFPVLLMFYATEYYYISLINASVAPWISLGFAGVFLTLYFWAESQFAKTGATLNSRAMILAFVTIVVFHSVYLELLPVQSRPWLLTVIMLGISLKSPSQTSRKEYFIPFLALAIIAAAEYIEIISSFIEYPPLVITAFASLASMWIFLLSRKSNEETNQHFRQIILMAAHLLAITAFYQVGNAYSSLAVSAYWLLYAIAVIVVANLRRDKIMAKSAMFVLGLAACKALLLDASSAATVIRILCLLITGATLYGAGFYMRKIDKWEK